jgi:hypothetical protein
LAGFLNFLSRNFPPPISTSRFLQSNRDSTRDSSRDSIGTKRAADYKKTTIDQEEDRLRKNQGESKEPCEFKELKIDNAGLEPDFDLTDFDLFDWIQPREVDRQPPRDSQMARDEDKETEKAGLNHGQEDQGKREGAKESSNI